MLPNILKLQVTLLYLILPLVLAVSALHHYGDDGVIGANGVILAEEMEVALPNILSTTNYTNTPAFEPVIWHGKSNNNISEN